MIASICTCDSRYLGRESDRITPQVIITLNLLRSSRRNPSFSEYAAMVKEFNFNSTPLAPLGTKLLIHVKPYKRQTFGSHAIDGWYIGPSIDQYRCYSCYVPETGGISNSDIVDFFPNKIISQQFTRIRTSNKQHQILYTSFKNQKTLQLA